MWLKPCFRPKVASQAVVMHVLDGSSMRDCRRA
jgi:hypothetical protein